MKSLLDTSAYAALRKGHLKVSQAVRESEQLFFSTVVLGEILFGFRNGSRFEKNLKELEEFLAKPLVTVQPVTRTTADRYGRIASSLRRQGTPIPTNDIWIAAHVLEAGAELITLDDHFEVVPGLPFRRFPP